MAGMAPLTSLLEYGIILLLSLFVAEFFKRIRQSEALAYLLLGIVLGPSFLNLIYPSEVLNFIAEVGAIMLLFTAGMETDISMLKRGGKKASILAIFGALFSFLFLFIPAYLLTRDFIFSFFVGATSVATSVGITIKIFSDFGKLRSEEAQTILIAAVIDDVIGVVFLTLAVNLAALEEFTVVLFLEILLRIIFFFLLMFVISIMISKYLFLMLENLQASGAKHIFAFSFALLAGYLASYYDLSPIIGAYMAGLIIGSTYIKEDIIKDISPVAFITVPVFFVLIGLKVNIYVPLNTIVLGVILTLLAALAKILGGLLTSPQFRNRAKLKKSFTLGVGMMPRGEVGFIFIKVGDDLGLISGLWYFALVFMILMTTFLTPILLKFLIGEGGDKPHE